MNIQSLFRGIVANLNPASMSPIRALTGIINDTIEFVIAVVLLFAILGIVVVIAQIL